MLKIQDLIGRHPPDDATVQKAFDLLLGTLARKIKKIHRVKHLYYPGTVKQFMSFGYDKEQFKNGLWGLQAKNRIYISNDCDKECAIRVLIHELAHFLFDLPDSEKEERACIKIEHRLWKRFTEEQKEKLWSYIPRAVTLDNVDKEKI